MNQKEKPPITVYVEANSGASEALSKSKVKEISDSAEDLRRQIEKRRDIVLATHPETADIVVTILDRAIEIAQNRQAEYVGGYTQNHYQSRHIITYRIEAGKSSHKAEYFNAGSFVTWNRVAAGLSKHIERWAKDHFEQLLQYRTQR
jgi:hypothetical protein